MPAVERHATLSSVTVGFRRRVAHVYWTSVFQSAVVGAIGGFLGWIPGEVESSWFDNLDAFTRSQYVYLDVCLYFLIIGMAIGAALGSLPGWQNRSRRQGMRGAVIGGIIGGVGGGLFSLPGQFTYTALGYGTVARGVAWAINGIGPGLCPGVATHDKRRAVRGLFGGLGGGFVAGVLFDLVWALLPHSAGDTGTSSRFAGDVVVGATIGLMVALVEVVLKDAWLTVISGRRNGAQFILSKTTTSIGTDDHDDVILWGDVRIAPQHAQVQRASRHYMFHNFSALNSTLVNGHSVGHATTLHDGDIIRLGETELVFRTQVLSPKHEGITSGLLNGPILTIGDALDVGLDHAVNANVRGKAPSLVNDVGVSAAMVSRTHAPLPYGSIHHEPTNGTPFFRLVAVDGTVAIRLTSGPSSLSIGRLHDNDIVIADPSVSGRHATMTWDGKRWIVHDMGSTNGTYVSYGGAPTDERLIRENALTDGSRIRFGNVAYRVEWKPGQP